MPNTPYLLALDFDNTAASTFEPSPGGTGVEQAYVMAITDLLGEQAGLIYTEHLSGQNLAPSEVIKRLMGLDSSPDLIKQAKEFYLTSAQQLQDLVPDNKGVNLNHWDHKHPEGMITELLVRQKLKYLLPQIGAFNPDGSQWPKPCEGFTVFWSTLNQLKQEGVDLKTAVISSGHDIFIQNTFDLWQLPSPDYLVTEDDIRGRKYPEEITRRAKPGTLQLALVHQRFLKDSGISFDLDQALETRKKIIYFGDDDKKDGGLARAADLPYGHFRSGTALSANQSKQRIEFGDWSDLAALLILRKSELLQGKPISEAIFSGQSRQLETMPRRFLI